MAKKGYVTRHVIEAAITHHLVKCGKTSKEATEKSRNYISDFKKEVLDPIRSKVILNEGNREREQYRCQDLGEWLYKRRGLLKEFRTPACPFKASFNLAVNEVIEISAIPTDLSDAERNDPDAIFAITIEKSLEIEKLKAEIAKYKEKEAATKKRQGMNSRGRPKR